MKGQRLTWKKWHPVDEALQVALETTLPAGANPQWREDVDMPPVDLEKEDMIYRAKEVRDGIRETVDRHYHPRAGSFPDLESSVRRASFKVHLTNGLFKRITLRRHASRGETAPRMWCGRIGEGKTFGFNAEGSKTPFYLPLAYPGKTDKFEPLFIKVEEYGETPYFLKVDARDEIDCVVVVEAKLISIREVPAFLRD